MGKSGISHHIKNANPMRQDVILPRMIEQRTPAISIDSQQFIDLLNLAYHREVAARLWTDPEVVLNQARNNLRRWLSAYESGEADARCFEEWQSLLETKSVPELVAIITQDLDEGQRLRSSTPFAGVLSPEKRKRLRQRCEEMVIAGLT